MVNMLTLETVLMVLLVADAIALGALVLLQHGKGADVGAAFGSGSSNTVFGSAGSASFLTKLTVWLAIGFFVISFGLAYTAKERAAGLDGRGVPQVEDVPADAPPPPSEPAEEPAGAPAGEPAGVDGRLTTEPERVDSDIPDV
ncbi:MAG: preprotein translocase subunit SecG [Pseudomonadota bacterium]